MDRYDLLLIVGLVCLAAGLWLVAPWLMLVLVGLVLVAGGLTGAARAEAKRRPTS
jgi:hypothetical protein